MPPIKKPKEHEHSIYCVFFKCLYSICKGTCPKQNNQKNNFIIGSSPMKFTHCIHIYQYIYELSYCFLWVFPFAHIPFSEPQVTAGSHKMTPSGAELKWISHSSNEKKGAPGCLGTHPRKPTWIPKTNCYSMAILVSILNFFGCT